MKALTQLSEEQLQADISRLTAAQQLMREANSAIERGDEEILRKLGFGADHIQDLQRPNASGTRGFPEYSLVNNEITIRVLNSQLAAIVEARNSLRSCVSESLTSYATT